MKTAAIYARVSSDQQKEEKTIASQVAALVEFAQREDYRVPPEWIFQDEGYSGSTLVRPGLERVRDLAAEGEIEAVLVLSPDRLSRKYAYQVLLMEVSEVQKMTRGFFSIEPTDESTKRKASSYSAAAS